MATKLVESQKAESQKSMQAKYEIEKRLGETPLEALERLRSDEKIPSDIPMTYAGRLDPAAEGLLLILTGEECKKKDEYNKYSKKYTAEIIIGIKTDTYDLLGVPEFTGTKGEPFSDFYPKVHKFFEEHRGRQMQKYPPYSSKALDTGIVPPPHEVEMFEYKIIKNSERSKKEIVDRAIHLTEIVTGDFRQEIISNAWKGIEDFRILPSVEIELTVSSGFYIRQLADDIGDYIGTGVCLYSLVRTEIK